MTPSITGMMYSGFLLLMDSVFANLMTCKICNPKIKTRGALKSFYRHVPGQKGRKCELPTSHIPAEAE